MRRSVEGAQYPRVASAHVPVLPAVLPMYHPAAPVALRGHRSELERPTPQHPVVYAAGLRRSALQEEGRGGGVAQRPGKGKPVPSRPREMVETEVRSPGELRLLRGGLAVVAAALVLVCSGPAIGALVGMAWAGLATAVAQVQADTVTMAVRPGQSLRDITEASGTVDVPGMMTRIVELNDLKGTTIHAGQTLEISVA